LGSNCTEGSSLLHPKIVKIIVNKNISLSGFIFA